MARFTAAVLVVGATLLLPPTLALVPEASSSPLSLEATPADALGGDVDAGLLTGSADAALDLASCRDAVELTLVGWGGTGGEVQPEDAAFLLPWTESSTVTEAVPVYQTTTEVFRTLFGLLPQTREVTRLVGYDTVTSTVSQTFDLAVLAEWDSEWIAWQEVTETVLVTLPVGLPLMATEGNGVLTKVCDPSVPILSSVPSQDTSGFDYWSMLPMSDGWYVHLLALDVHLASAEEAASLPYGNGWALCPTDVASAIGPAADALGLRPGASGVTPTDGAAELVPSASEGGFEPSSAGVSAVTAAPALGALAVLAALGAAAGAWRKLR